MLQVDSSLIVVFVIVWILVVVLTRVFFNPIRKVMRDRQEGIDQDRLADEAACSEIVLNLQKIEEDIKEARTSAGAIRESFEKKALKEKERLISEVSQECRAQVNEARKELKEQTENLKAEIKAESDDLAESIEKRLLH